MLLNIVYLVGGLLLILWGASILTDGSSDVARRMGVSDLMVGMTVIGLGTSMPELSVSLLSAYHGSASMAIGNVVGSNLFNVLVIMGLTSMVMPVKVDHAVIGREMPLLIVSSILLLVMGNDILLDGASENILTRVDGIILLLLFAIYMWVTISQAKGDTPADSEPPASEAAVGGAGFWLKAIAMIIGGLAALVFGADKFVEGASEIARAIGMSEAVIGLTIVAAGTSLPELATALTSAIKGKPGLAIGNVIGSNIFNVFLILGVTATYRPLPFGGIGNFDLLTQLLATFLFWLFARYYKTDKITRPEGALLFALYIFYTLYLLLHL